jgi:putative transposase
MFMYSGGMALPRRKQPPHQPPCDQHNRSVIVFVTVCTKRRRPVLAQRRVHDALVDAWTGTREWRVGRHVVLPDHVHLFCAPAGSPPSPLASWVRYWKRLVTRATGIDGLWQAGFWDTQLRHEEAYDAKWLYVQQNPVRHGLVAEAAAWPYQGQLETLAWHE